MLVKNQVGRILEMSEEEYKNAISNRVYLERVNQPPAEYNIKQKQEQKQEVVVKEPPTLDTREEVEIILIRFNHPEVEDKAIDCVKKNTSWPYELTIFDNYQAGNIPLSKLWNDMIAKSHCKYVCLLNSDAFVTKGWLEEMMAGFSVARDVGAVGPSGDKVGGEQRGLGSKNVADNYRGKYKEIDFLSGFCMLMKKGIAEFPEEVPFYGGEHAWETSAKRNGYKMIWAQGAFVQHLCEASAIKAGTRDKLRKEGQLQFIEWMAKTTPVLYTTYNRLEYTQKTLPKLLESKCGTVMLVDNCSTDGTQDWLRQFWERNPKYHSKLQLFRHDKNKGVVGAMNTFFEKTKHEEYVAKVDNDTIVPNENWLRDLLKMANYRNIDILQAKHPIWHNTYETFDEWMKDLRQDDKNSHIFYSPFVGGSGVVIRRYKIKTDIPASGWVLGGWTAFQEHNKDLLKAFCDNVEMKLLDMKKDNEADYDKYPDYYKEVGRDHLRFKTKNVENTILEIIDKLGKRFAYLRFGDAELKMMEDFKGHPHTQWTSEEFKKELIESFEIDNPDYLIGNIAGMVKEPKAEAGLLAPFPEDEELKKITKKFYKDKMFYSPIAFHYLYAFERELLDFVMKIIGKKTVALVGGEHLKGIKNKIGVNTFIPTPSEQSFDTIDEWYPKVQLAAKRHDVLLIALAMTTNVVQKRLWEEKINVGTIDFGSVANAIVNYKGDKHNWIKRVNEKSNKV